MTDAEIRLRLAVTRLAVITDEAAKKTILVLNHLPVSPEVRQELDEAAAQDLPLIERLDRLNSSFPETRKFLEAKGVKRVSELSPEHRIELVQHLEGVLAQLLAKPEAGGQR